MPTEWVAVRVVSRTDFWVVPFVVYSTWLVEGSSVLHRTVTVVFLADAVTAEITGALVSVGGGEPAAASRMAGNNA